jgi:hypothetical protein
MEVSSQIYGQGTHGIWTRVCPRLNESTIRISWLVYGCKTDSTAHAPRIPCTSWCKVTAKLSRELNDKYYRLITFSWNSQISNFIKIRPRFSSSCMHRPTDGHGDITNRSEVPPVLKKSLRTGTEYTCLFRKQYACLLRKNFSLLRSTYKNQSAYQNEATLIFNKTRISSPR